MKISARFAEYTISGGMFWICIAIFLTFYHINAGTIGNGDARLILQGGILEQSIQFWAEIIRIFIEKLPENANYTPTIITNLLTGLSVIAIFCTGILLDTISPLFFTPFELMYFKKCVRNNRHWLQQSLENHNAVFLQEYDRLLNEPLFCWKEPNSFWRQRHYYVRFRTFLFANAYASYESEKLEDLKDRIHLWHTSRSLGAAIFILALLLNTIEIFQIEADIGMISAVYYIPLFYIIAVLMALGSYSRMCDALFTVTYFSGKQEGKDKI